MFRQSKFATAILATVLVIVLALGALYFFLNSRSKEEAEKAFKPTQQGTQKGDIGYEEQDQTVEIGSQEVSIGNFVQVAQGNIQYKEGDFISGLPMSETVVLACTEQVLESAQELDFEEIIKVFEMTPAELGSTIPSNELIVVFALPQDGGYIAHTVAMNADSCDL
jgi:hypothetical protein